MIRTALNLTKLINPILFRQPKLLYSTTEKKNVFVLPKKQNIHTDALCSLTDFIVRSTTVAELAYLFRDNIQSFTDLHTAALWDQMALLNLQLDESLHSLIIPITIEYINSFTRNNGNALGTIALSALKLNVQSPELWNALFNKLHNQSIFKYLTLAQVVRLLNGIAINGKFVKSPLVAKLQAIITKQKLYYDHHPQLLQLIRESVQILQKNGGEKPLQLTQAYNLLA